MVSKKGKTKKPNWKLKAITLAKALVRRQGFCDWCGKTSSEGQLHGAHIMPEEYVPTACDPENIIVLCASCHKFKKSAWHKSPLEAAEWFHAKLPGRYAQVYKKAHSGIIPDWEVEYKKLVDLSTN